MNKILLVGASGMLGSSILEALLAKQLPVRVLLRPGKPQLESTLQASGVEVVHGDVLDPQTLGPAMQGIRVVVSSLHNDPALFVQGHQNLISSAEAAGVERLVPSDFSVDFFKLEPGENFNLDMRKQVVPFFQGKKLRPIHILIGAFMDTMLDPRAPFIDWAGKQMPYFGDGLQLNDFTSVRDAGRYVAEAVADPQAPEILRFAGCVLTMPEFAQSVTQATGRELRAVPQGTLDDLLQAIESKKKTAQNPFEWIALQYHHNMVSGKAKLDPLDNARYPGVAPETVREFVQRVEDVQGLSRSGA